MYSDVQWQINLVVNELENEESSKEKEEEKKNRNKIYDFTVVIPVN